MYWHLVGETRTAAEHPAEPRTAPTTKTYPTQNGNSAEAEKLRCIIGLLPQVGISENSASQTDCGKGPNFVF